MSEGKMLRQTRSQQLDDNLQQVVSIETQDMLVQSDVMSIQAEQQYRASAYSILAALLRSVPAQESQSSQKLM